MLIEIHAIQNHSPANLNRDDLGAPKTCYFGGVMRSRISSQCLKRSIRKSEQFQLLCGGIRTRRLPKYLADRIAEKDVLALAEAVVRECGLIKDEAVKDSKKDVIVFLSRSSAAQMEGLLRNEPADVEPKRVTKLARQFAELIARDRFVPDMALSGRMLEPGKPKGAKKGKARDEASEQEDSDAKDKGVWKGLDLRIEAALQVAHGISTHEARPEVDYFVAADDIPGDDAGAAHVDEAMFASACFYKYFSIHWEQLLTNLGGFQGNKEHLAAHTVGAFLRGAAMTTPTGKQNSFAAHNPPDGMLVEIKQSPVSYANAFASPVPCKGPRDMVCQSIAQLGQYVHDLDVGYGKPDKRFWFSPNLRHPLTAIDDNQEIALADHNLKSLDELVVEVVRAVGFDWAQVQAVTVK